MHFVTLIIFLGKNQKLARRPFCKNNASIRARASKFLIVGAGGGGVRYIRVPLYDHVNQRI